MIVYWPRYLPITVSALVYVALTKCVTAWENIKLLLYSTVLLFLVQETVVGGPPVVMQVRMNRGGSRVGSVRSWNWRASCTTMCPEGERSK